MTRRMLINAQNPEELRIAIVTGPHLDNYEVATAASGLMRGNIYRGVVSSIQPGLEAAFVDIGTERHGLLKADDIVPAAFHRKPEGGDTRRPERCLERGRPILVQVARDAVGTKGCLLTTNISLAGRYLVLMPFEPARGVSRRVEDEELRRGMRERLEQLDLPEDLGVIVRTNAAEAPKAALNRDLGALQRLWRRISAAASTGKGPRLLYTDQDLIVQAIRDHLGSDIEEVLVDSEEAYARVEEYMRSFMPRAKTRLVRYEERMPLFSRFDLEQQVDRIYQRKVELPGGGSIVIDPTEALTAIDVNSGRAKGGGSQEETARTTNLEAAREVARQLRLRDIGGLVVVDFIDMRGAKNQRAVEKEVRDALKEDKARIAVGRISSNGLLEINRQRIKSALRLRTHRPCPTCGGAGTIASPELVGHNLLRRIETRAVTGRLAGVRVELHPELADALQNSHRQELAALEREFDLKIELIASAALHRSEERISWSERSEQEVAAARTAAEHVLSAADLGNGGESAAKDGARTGRKEAAAAADEAVQKPARRRRRGGRRHRKSTDAREVEAVASGSEAAGGSDSSVEGEDREEEAGLETAAVEGAVSQEQPGAGRKRKRRRGRRGKKTAGAKGENAAPPQQTASEEAAG